MTMATLAMVSHTANCNYCTFSATIDTNECDMETDSCQQYCNNTIGSYECYCDEGYELNNTYYCHGKHTACHIYIMQVLKISMSVQVIMVAVIKHVSILLVAFTVNV